ncbi:MAG TPA: hypothetical protein VFP28_11830 [Gemmatimonadales bacterium]|nr:hypothetical protein [Gemmatimonadales bacterium]
MRRRRALARLAPLLLAGCYTYRPLPAPVPAAGTRVQIALTDDGSDSLSSRIGPGIDLVSGDVIRADTGSVTLAVRAIENRRGERDDWLGEAVVVPRRFVRDIEQRQMSLGGTGLLGGAIAAGLVAATAAMGSGGSQGGGGTAGGGAGH